MDFFIKGSSPDFHIRTIVIQCFIKDMYVFIKECTYKSSPVISRLRILLFDVYKSIKHLNPKCIIGTFEVKSTNYV